MTSIVSIWYWTPTLSTYPDEVKDHVALFRKIKILFGLLLFSSFIVGIVHFINKISAILYFINFCVMSYEYLEMTETHNDFNPGFYIGRIIYQHLIMIAIPIFYKIKYNFHVSKEETWCNIIYYSIILIHNMILWGYLIKHYYLKYKEKQTYINMGKREKEREMQMQMQTSENHVKVNIGTTITETNNQRRSETTLSEDHSV